MGLPAHAREREARSDDNGADDPIQSESVSTSQPHRNQHGRDCLCYDAPDGEVLTMDVRLRLILLFAASVPLLLPQEYRATVSGNVTDPGGAGVPAARVTAINNQTTVAASTVTGPNGAF